MYYKERLLTIAVLCALTALSLAQVPDRGFTSQPGKAWHEGFEPVQQKITAEAHNQGLEGALRFLSVYRISFYVDRSLMRRQSGPTSDNMATKFLFHFRDWPIWKVMDFLAAEVGGLWKIEDGICVLRANAIQSNVELVAPAKSDVIYIPPGETAQPAQASTRGDTVIVRSADSWHTLDQRAADYMRINLTSRQRAIMRSRGFLKSSELSGAQRNTLREWLQTIKPGRIKAVQSKGVYSQIKRIN